MSRHDQGSLATLWVAIGAGIGLGVWATSLVPSLGFSLPPPAVKLVVVAFAGGLALRWWAIFALGKYFTVDVAIASDHRLVTHGPYRLVRHPSYTGMLIAFVALTVSFQNWISLPCTLVPIVLALAYRIRVEEAALLAAFGDDYRQYCQNTKRLIPALF